ncbi:hypothetical protein B7991_10740 [Fibrobacter sp. UWB3]|nr:hypothetical protein B7991_10740 [Fibrobacter sp. UWB3]
MPCSIIWTGRFFCGVLGAEPLGERVMEDLVDLIGVFQTDCGDAGAEIRGRLAPFNRKGYFGMKEIAYEKRI